QIMEEDSGARGNAMAFLIKRPSEILSTILVGNNIVNILAASLTTTITGRYFQSDAIGVSVGITTLIILIFGEIIPKTFARVHAEKLALYVIWILKSAYIVLFPIVMIITYMAKKILGENAEISGRMVTKDDIEYMVERAEVQKTIDSKQLGLLNSILEFPTIKVKDIMIPRQKVKVIPLDATFEEILEYIQEDNHSRYPVCKKDLEDTMGVLHIKDLAYIRGERRQKFNVKDLLKSPFFVYEHMKIQAVFDHMNQRKNHLALIKDENGLVVGIVTLEDIVEEILGEIQDEHDLGEIERSKDGKNSKDISQGVVVSGEILLRDFYNEYGIKIPLNDNYSTLGGFVLDMLGNNFPQKGQIIVWQGYSFELVKVIDHHIEKIGIRDVDGEKQLYSKHKNGNERKEQKVSE
ncbi:MAG: hemolysin family protein, partial [Halobacteriovoraceae bacterium]|nr:hemolysin family protein [Halobacteriovoraceae bacterium]